MGKISTSKRKRIFIYALLILICGSLATLLLVPNTSQNTGFPEFSKETSPELAEIESGDLQTFSQLATYFREISEKKGAVYSFEVLKYAKLPPRTDLHLLAHSVGDMLYKQQGIEGMKYCTDEFRNACSHSIVIGTLLDQGEDSLTQFSDICKKAPGGTGAYQMCFHGLGHGVLAYANYDLEKAVHLCQKTGTTERDYREYTECVGGAVMEIIGGGDHDRTTYRKMRGNYIKKDDPLSPCDMDIIPMDAKYLCYTYITPNMVVAAGANLGNPDPKYFPKAFSYCDVLDIGDKNRDACYGGFGKEFPALANSRDIRTVDEINETQMKQVYSWCLMAEKKDGIKSCVSAAVQSLFWGGETNPEASYKFCNLLDEDYRITCQESLAGSINNYIKDPTRKAALCNQLPKDRQKKCAS